MSKFQFINKTKSSDDLEMSKWFLTQKQIKSWNHNSLIISSLHDLAKYKFNMFVN